MRDIEGLVELCEVEAAPLPAALADIDRLTPYGVRLGYGAVDVAAPVERETALRWAEQTMAWAQGIIDAAG
jgi:hypothetical protein